MTEDTPFGFGSREWLGDRPGCEATPADPDPAVSEGPSVHWLDQVSALGTIMVTRGDRVFRVNVEEIETDFTELEDVRVEGDD